MDNERPSTGRTGERPMTRWRREPEDIDRSQSRTERPYSNIGRSQTKIERPSSRRGTQNDGQELVPSAGFRSTTPSRNVMGRPPSASAFSSRATTSSSQVNTMNLGVGLRRLSTGLPQTAQVNVSVMDRPITQQGIAGVRPGTTRGLPMTRQVQDRRYYEGLLQLKIRELTQEIAAISRHIDSQSRERATFLHYDKRAKDMAAELSDLQGQLADYNIVVDKMASDAGKDSIELEATQLAQTNDQSLSEIERMFSQRQQREQLLRGVEKDIQSEKKNAERIVADMEQDVRNKYNELQNQKIELQDAIDKMQRELDQLSSEKVRMEEQIALSQVKQEAVKLHVKITEVEEKRDRLREEEKNRLSPEEEREQLLLKVKQDNTEIAAAERQLADLKKRMTEAEHELEQLETDLEDSQSERHVKYKELRKREEAMEQFMAAFDENKLDEIERLEKLEGTVVERLEKLSIGINNDPHLTASEEKALLNIQTSNEDFEGINLDQSMEGLSIEHTRLQQSLIKMETLEKRLKSELMELNEKINKRESELIILEDLEGLKARSELKREELMAEQEKLRVRHPSTKQELTYIQNEYKEIKGRLDNNETFVQISSLEDKLERLKQSNKNMEDFITEQHEQINYRPLKDQVFGLVEQYNSVLKENMKPIY